MIGTSLSHFRVTAKLGEGRWIAYQSPGSGAASVYVRPVEGEGKWQVSPTGGSYPCAGRRMGVSFSTSTP